MFHFASEHTRTSQEPHNPCLSAPTIGWRIDNIDLIAQAIGDPPHELMDPNLPKHHGLDESLNRSPWTVRPYVIKER